MDRVDPRASPIGHLLADAPEYVVGAAAAALAARHVGTAVYKKRKKDGKGTGDATVDAIIAGCLAGSAAGRLAFLVAKKVK